MLLRSHRSKELLRSSKETLLKDLSNGQRVWRLSRSKVWAMALARNRKLQTGRQPHSSSLQSCSARLVDAANGVRIFSLAEQASQKALVLNEKMEPRQDI